MRRMATIAVALAFVALVFQGGGARACDVNVVNATISVTISGDNATFVVTYPPETEVNGNIRLVPRPLVFNENAETGCWETGNVGARLIVLGANQEVALLIPRGHGPYENETVVRFRGPVDFQCSPITPGTIEFGPMPLIRPDIIDPFGGNGPIVITIRPDIIDPF